MFCLWEVWLCFYYIYALLLRHFILLFDFCNLFEKKIASEDAALTLWQKMMSDEQVMTFPPFLTRRKYKSSKYHQNQSNFLFIYEKLEWLWPFCKNLSKMFDQQKLFWLRNFVIEGVACQPPSSLRRLQATPPLQTSLALDPM